ncbi:UDP-2,3-diacylglucosamine diphosphatase [Aquirufa sp. ROCK-SH2]
MTHQITIPSGKKIYFASDFHLGFPNVEQSLLREKELMLWLDAIKSDAKALFLVGDLFDFWFEYKEVVPKGFVRFIGKLAELSDAGIDIHIFVGNHDLWMWDYFEKEIAAKIYREPTQFDLHFDNHQETIFVGHGDGLGPGDYGFKALKKVFTSKLAQFCFSWLHPDLGVKLAHLWSNTRKTNAITEGFVPFDPETDYILTYVREKLNLHVAANTQVNAYIFGHRHHPIEFPLNGHSTYYNLGDWFSPDFKNAFYLTISENETNFQAFK